MRFRFLVTLMVVVLVALAIIFWLRPVKQPAIPKPAAQEASQPANKTQVAASSVNQVTPIQPSVSVPPGSPKPESDEGKIERIVREANQTYEQPIEFYGLVVDQDSNPLPNVKIDASVLYEHVFMPTASGDFPITNNLVRLEKETGADGRFELEGVKGRNVVIEVIQKGGYEFESGLPKTFGASGGSFSEPMIFKMWSTNIHEQLITGNKSFDIVPDGRPYFINLTGDTISESSEGDLKVWIQYTNQVVRGQLYDWSCAIEVVSGGLLEEPLGSPMYEAPTVGYSNVFGLQGQIRGGQRGDTGERQFYLMLKNGQEYGQMSIGLYAPFNDQTPGLVHLSYAVNPSGSHILR